MRLRVVRRNGQRLLAPRNGLGGLVLNGEFIGDGRVGDEVSRRDPGGMLEERGRVTPMRHLPGREYRAGAQDQRRRRRGNPARPRAAGDHRRGAPDHEQEQADVGQVSVAIRHGLLAHLHQPDHRHQHAQEPQPADLQGAPRRAGAPNPGGHRCQQQPGAGGRPRIKPETGIGIKDRQVSGPKGLAQVARIRHQRIGQAQFEGVMRQRHHRAAGPLRLKGHQARQRRERKERNLLQQHPPQRRRGPLPGRQGEPLQGPPVQQQQHARQRDQHRLAHQPQRKAKQGQQIKPPGAARSGGGAAGRLRARSRFAPRNGSRFRGRRRLSPGGRGGRRERAAAGVVRLPRRRGGPRPRLPVFLVRRLAPPGISRIRPQRQQKEERAQHVLALRDPGDGFHMQRVQSKQRGHQRAAPDGAGQALPQAEQQEGVGQVQQHAREVMAPRLQPIKLAIEHVRKPRQRMPVAGMETLARPREVFQGQPGLNPRVAADVVRVVVIDEAELEDRPVNRGNRQRQQQAKQEGPPGGTRRRPLKLSAFRHIRHDVAASPCGASAKTTLSHW